MSYAVAVVIYIVSYILGTVLPLILLEGDSVIRVVIFSIPVLLVGPRVSQRFTDGTQLLPRKFREQGGFLLGGGQALIWIGHLAFFGAIAAAIYLATHNTAGVPVGILAGLAFFPYLLGIVLVEISYRGWSNRQPEQAWKSKRGRIFVVVGLVVGAHLAFAIGNAVTGPGPDLLSYHEREALAYGRGYAREVQRAAEAFYEEEGRIPCKSDNYIDIDSLLGGINRDVRKELSIELIDCGQFVVTIHKPIDGVADGQLLYVASPGDASAGKPLGWDCFSAHHERIERHTKGGCTYDSSLARILPAPVDEKPTVEEAGQPLAAKLERPSAVATDRVPGANDYLERLDEPALWENCGADVTSYRILKFDAGQYAAAVRISHDTSAGSYRSATSTSPTMIKSLDGYVDDRMWQRVEAQFSAAGFWNLQSVRRANGAAGPRIYVEACKDGQYRAVERGPGDPDLAPIVDTFTRVGRLEWLEGS